LESIFVDPAGDHVPNRSSSPLRSHVSNSLDGDEIKAIIRLFVTGDLRFINPRGPWGGDFPVELLDPSFGTKCWDSAICVSRVVHHFNTDSL